MFWSLFMCFCLQFTLYLVNCLFSCFTLLYHVFSTKIPHIVMIRDTGEVPKVPGQEELIERREKPSPEIFAGAKVFSLDRGLSIERAMARSSEQQPESFDRARPFSIERELLDRARVNLDRARRSRK